MPGSPFAASCIATVLYALHLPAFSLLPSHSGRSFSWRVPGLLCALSLKARGRVLFLRYILARPSSSLSSQSYAPCPPVQGRRIFHIMPLDGAYLSKALRYQERVPDGTRPRPARTLVCRQPHRRVLEFP